MYTVSNLWESLAATEGHTFESKATIDGITYGQDKLMSMSISLRMFSEEQPSVGGCLSGELTLSMLAPSVAIPRMAVVIPYVRVTDGTQYSEWIPQGKFFIDTRETTKNSYGISVLTLHAYDAMLKTEADYPATSHDWPQTDIATVQEIASAIGVGVDARTWELMTHAYSIGLPLGYSMRETLGNIAAMYAGNWVLNYNGDLLLIALNGVPSETRYLIDGFVGEVNQHILTNPFVISQSGIAQARQNRSSLTLTSNGGLKVTRNSTSSTQSYGTYWYISDPNGEITNAGHIYYVNIHGIDHSGAQNWTNYRILFDVYAGGANFTSANYETMLPTTGSRTFTLNLVPGAAPTNGEYFTIDWIQVVDLTDMYGAGNESLDRFKEEHGAGIPYPYNDAGHIITFGGDRILV